jgi:hypothetical protein
VGTVLANQLPLDRERCDDIRPRIAGRAEPIQPGSERSASLSVLHRSHASAFPWASVPPPFERGRTWSRVGATIGSPQ